MRVGPLEALRPFVQLVSIWLLNEWTGEEMISN